MTQFIIEAIVLSEIGGIIGVGMGFAVGKLFGLAAKMPTAIPIWSVVLGLLFCSMVGLFFGIWPAAKAANLKPIEALRYE
jgi:putative ABC transport system permease protein